jgi:glycine/D-amino acid oxidase-like deaminating enzyme/nitrite reductase/ring-hydroxylating ferredoxin subunit
MVDKDKVNQELKQQPKSYWTEFKNIPEFPNLQEDITVDVAVIGGGITGITSGYLLANEGLKVAILEADQLLNGTTGHTTAKITAQHGLIYDEFITNFGKSKAKLYYEANIQALAFIEKTIETKQIECEFSKQDAYLYATTKESYFDLQKEASAYEKLGIKGELIDDIPLDIEIKNALVMRNQAQFHPLKYLSQLVHIFIEKGGLIYENSVAVNIDTSNQPTVLTRNESRVTAKHILICTHFPFYEGLGLYSTRMHADRSYVLAAKTRQKYPGGMYLSVDKPTRSLRSATINGEEMVLIVGEDHKTGQGIDTQEHYKALETFGQDVFGIESIPYHWSAQDLITMDKIPYIGEITSGQPNVMIATGYRKWGMTNATVAALMFRDKVLGNKNIFHNLFTPSRFYAQPSLKNFFLENANVAAQLIKGKLEVTNLDPNLLGNDEGAVISIKGERKGAYKDETGQLHIVDTTCTHIGCEVEWNSGERTWDCPCHGSRFSYQGDVIEGPAEKPLQKHDYKMIDNLTSEDSGY